MNLYKLVVFLTSLSFSQAYKNYGTAANPDYCFLGNTPVCGTNGFENFRLDNECEFNTFNSKQLESGQMVLSKTAIEDCYPPPASPAVYGSSSYNTYCPKYCNKIFKPVCASYRNVQRNFTNECELKKHICDTKTNWQIILNGTCVAASCALDGQEVCASYNNYTQSFPNLLSLYGDIQATGKNWQILNVGPCPCPSDYWPICAQLNCTAKTFENQCFLEQEIKNGNLWSILFFGECPELPTTVATTEAPNETDPTAVPNGTDPTPVANVTDAPTPIASSTAKAICNLSNLLYGPNKAINNKPVYIVRKNKISPYGLQGYKLQEKIVPPINYPSFNPTVYSGPSYHPLPIYGASSKLPNNPLPLTYADVSYKHASTPAPLIYNADAAPLPKQSIYKSSNYGTYIHAPTQAPLIYNADADPLPKQSIYKPSNYGTYKHTTTKEPLIYNADADPLPKPIIYKAPNYASNPVSAYSSTYNYDPKPMPHIYKSKSPSNLKYIPESSSDYNPVTVKPSNCNKVPEINYGGDNYEEPSLLDSGYETFT